jgi:hypothetical protein
MVAMLSRLVIVAALPLLCAPATAQKFFPDDPLEKELKPLNTVDPNYRSLSPILDYFTNTFSDPGERHPASGVIPARGINTLGDVLEGSWYVKRHAKRPMSPLELRRGPGDRFPPATDRPWDVLTAKGRGFRPGMLVEDSAERQYLLRFDPPGRLEMSTGAQVVASNLLYALGYWTTENYIVYFDRGQLRASEEGADIDTMGKARNLLEEDIDEFLKEVALDPERGYRGVATRLPAGVPLGPFQAFGTRSDDPNDLFAHEHRRDMRGFYVFASWLNHISGEAATTLDMLVEEEFEGERLSFIRHYLVDLSSSLGSGAGRQKEAREGNDPIFSSETTVQNFSQFGVITPLWMKARYPRLPGVGRFEYDTFEPDQWDPNYTSAPFDNRLPDDEFWAAKILMTLTDEDIRAVVSTGQYSDSAAEKWITKCLIERRDKIGSHYLSRVLPLDSFRVENNVLEFEDLGVKHGFTVARSFEIHWSTFDNLRETSLAISGADSFQLPVQAQSSQEGSYFLADILGNDPAKRVRVFVRQESAGFKVIGVERNWPGKKVAQPKRPPPGNVRTRYPQLSDGQRKLFDTRTKLYNEQTTLNLASEQYWSTLSVSERTTFDAVTHALERTELSDENGQSLGKALDLCLDVDSIAGQYYGRGGDQQFRIYFKLRPDTREILEKSREFYHDHDNTVYHIGYPFSHRQTGKPPTIQFSMSEDGLKGDIDVDYRSSKMPRAMWNGHITSANSDVRAGKNYSLHTDRWMGLSAWWNVFGEFEPGGRGLLDLFSRTPPIDHIDLPPDRPSGASPEKVEDAAQEFLTDWLQRSKYDEALEFVSDAGLGCIGRNREIDAVIDGPTEGRRVMRGILKDVRDELQRVENLAEAIEGVEPWRRNVFSIIDHPYRQAFAVFSASDEVAKQYLCEPSPAIAMAVEQAKAQVARGTYHGVMIRFRFGEQGGTLALGWAKQNGRWKIVSWDIVEQ